MILREQRACLTCGTTLLMKSQRDVERKRYCSVACRGLAQQSNLIGERFGRLLVTRLVGMDSGGRTLWECKCDCGTLKIFRVGNLGSHPNQTRSCGCLSREIHHRHGEASRGNQSAEYKTYCAAITRCTNGKQDNFPRYGGCGVKFLFRSFTEFLAAVGRKPTPKHSLDRINPYGNYEPGNVRWATAKEQASNRRPRTLK